jgi:hypothetical protein
MEVLMQRVKTVTTWMDNAKPNCEEFHDSEVNALLRSGWRLFGSPACVGDMESNMLCIVQCLVLEIDDDA